MGSPLSSVIADFYMEALQKMALEQVPSTIYRRYMDDTFFFIWTHGRVSLDEFVLFLNGLHENITFTMETERTIAIS